MDWLYLSRYFYSCHCVLFRHGKSFLACMNRSGLSKMSSDFKILSQTKTHLFACFCVSLCLVSVCIDVVIGFKSAPWLNYEIGWRQNNRQFDANIFFTDKFFYQICFLIKSSALTLASAVDIGQCVRSNNFLFYCTILTMPLNEQKSVDELPRLPSFSCQNRILYKSEAANTIKIVAEKWLHENYAHKSFRVVDGRRLSSYVWASEP